MNPASNPKPATGGVSTTDAGDERAAARAFLATVRISAFPFISALALGFLMPHRDVSAGAVWALTGSLWVLAGTALVCAVCADSLSARPTPQFAVISVVALVGWVALALVGVWLSWDGERWIDLGHPVMRSITAMPVIMAVLILYGSNRVAALRQD